MRIYVADLAAYNNGRLHGVWIDASDDVAAMNEQVNAMLAKSPYPNVVRQQWKCTQCDHERLIDVHYGDSRDTPGQCFECESAAPEDFEKVGEPFPSAEEYAIHDHEGLGDLGEYAGLGEVAKRFQLAELAEDRRIPLNVLQQWHSDRGQADDDIDDIESALDDAYRGTADNWADFAQELTEEVNDMSAVPDWLQYHIDWESMGREFEISGDFNGYQDSGTLYVFWAH